MESRLRRGLARANPIVFTLVAGLAGFSAYFSMYAFRKPFAAATFDAVPGWHFVLDYKIALVLAQLVGYALSKLIGIKLVSGHQPCADPDLSSGAPWYVHASHQGDHADKGNGGGQIDIAEARDNNSDDCGHRRRCHGKVEPMQPQLLLFAGRAARQMRH